MRIDYSKISCGIWQLYDVDDGYEDKYPTAKKLARALYRGGKWVETGQIIIASLAAYQKRAKKFLKAEGFKTLSKSYRNPNSGNKIVLYMKRLSKSDRARYYKLSKSK